MLGCALVNDTILNLPEGSSAGFCLQLMKQPHGMWIQRSDSINRGVTAGASRVRKKLNVSREELRTFTACRISTKVWERTGEIEINLPGGQLFKMHWDRKQCTHKQQKINQKFKTLTEIGLVHFSFFFV